MSKELSTHAYNGMPNGELADGLSFLAKVIGSGREINLCEVVALLTVASCRLKGYPQPKPDRVVKELLAALEGIVATVDKIGGPLMIFGSVKEARAAIQKAKGESC